MKYPRGVVLFIVLGAMAALIFVTRSGTEGLDAGTALPVVNVAMAQPQSSDQGQTPTAPILMTQTAPPVATVSQQALNPSPTPMSFYAPQLQTAIPENTLSPALTVVAEWNPPPLEVPLAHHPFDHYWLIRPVSSNYTNSGLSYYPYGSDGPQNDLRIHRGIDIANPIGVEVHAAGDGTVVWAGKGHLNEYERITSYGNTVVIEHDFGYAGQRVYTLYAHLSAILVARGEHVLSGQVIGLVGNTGQVTGPHVHFEVHIGIDSYFATRNPMLWIAPYTGTGVIAGRITFPNGGVVTDAQLTLIDRETGRIVDRTSSYAGFGVTSDDNWNENFVFSDVPVGRYLVTSRLDNITWSGEVNVMPGTTNWVTLERYTPESSDNEEGQP